MTDPDVIERVSTTMIPVAFDYYKIVDSSTRESKFLSPKMEKRNQYQGVWIFSPDAKVLGGYESSVPLHRFEEIIDHGRAADCLKKTQMEINRVMSSFGPLTPRPASKGSAVRRFHPPRSDGSIDLPLYVRRRGASNVNSPIISQATLTADDLACFLPTTTELTTEVQSWVIPNRVTRKFYRALSPLGSESAPAPEWIRDSELKAKLEKASTVEGWIDVQLEGFIVSAEQGYSPNSVHSEQKLTLDGLCRFDRESKQLVSIQIVGTGSICWIHEAPDKPVQFDALIEWFAEQN